MTDSTTLTPQDKTLGMLCHLLAFCGLIIPFGNIIGPLVIWLVKKNESSFVDDQGKESLNFQITATIILTAAMILSGILTLILIGFLLIPLVGIAALAVLVFVVIASIKANDGVAYRYPWSIKFIK
ncbi:DUF4870 domain-containing protein [Kamptonema cortianum]|nr:DUF4870 domain-containing protein [Kamptonema cortianum]MDL5049756.1 DUF4870 domain-containing protein [Oscillatoria amoena NRMC-F 0135]